MSKKSVNESSIEIVMQMTHQDANLAGNVHGGMIMKYIDNTAAIVASRHTQGNSVTASIDRLDFHSPVFVGDMLRLQACINYVGRTSMEVGVRVEAENFITGETRHTASAYLTFVPLDGTGKPREVPPVEFKSDEEVRRNCAAKERRNYRLSLRNQEETNCK